jgi:hypothetical protein
MPTYFPPTLYMPYGGFCIKIKVFWNNTVSIGKYLSTFLRSLLLPYLGGGPSTEGSMQLRKVFTLLPQDTASIPRHIHFKCVGHFVFSFCILLMKTLIISCMSIISKSLILFFHKFILVVNINTVYCV